MNKTKSVLIGTFVNKKKILSFLEFIKRKFGVKLDNTFVYEIESNNNEFIVTFKAQEKEKFLTAIKHSTVLHVKNGSLFSINALNKLIETKSDGINHQEYVIDWSEYCNKLIILTNGELHISNINKIEDKTVFFK